jgi:hypothetical protein
VICSHEASNRQHDGNGLQLAKITRKSRIRWVAHERFPASCIRPAAAPDTLLNWCTAANRHLPVHLMPMLL